jgi:TonB family protein
MVHPSLPRSLVLRLARTAPVVIGSVLLHAGIAMALVATAGGHARAGITLPVVATLDVDVAPIDAPTLEPVREEAPPPNAVREPAPTHTHTYPVAPSHDAHPHDPSLHHDEAHPHEHEAEPAEAAPVLTQPAEASALPRFSIPSGAGLPTGGHVSVNGTGSGAGAATATTSAGDDVIVPASGVQVAAKLVQSVVAAYPAGARSDDVEGDVGVEIVVDREGRVVDARIARPAGHGFDDAALAAIRRYRFTPAQREGHAVRVRMPWSVQFRLR